LREKIITRVEEMANDIIYFKRTFQYVYNQGLPCIWDGNLDVFTKDKYNEMMLETINDDSKFEELEHRLNGETIK